MKKPLLILIIMTYLLFLNITLMGTDALKIKNITVKSITDNSAKIEWDTNIDTTGQVNYGISISRMKNLSLDVNKRKKHDITLKNLLKGTPYYYQILVKKAGVISTSTVKLFKTTGIPAPLLINSLTKNIKHNSANIHYMLNTPCKIFLTYVSKKNNKKKIMTINKYKIKGIIGLKDLTPETVYYYTFEIINKENKKSKIKIYHFTTPIFNLALNKKVSGTFDKIPDDPLISRSKPMIERITDGNFNYFHGTATSGNIKKKDQFIIIDMGKQINFKKIITHWNALAFSKDYSILISKDKNTWKKIKTKLNAQKAKNYKGDNGVNILKHTILFKPLKIRYIKLMVKKNSAYYVKDKNWTYLQLMEIEISN